MALILKMCFAIVLALLVSNLFVSIESATTKKREIQTENQSEVQTQTETIATTEKRIKICDTTLSCGWAVYVPFTREIKYFMKNSCDCPDNQHCIRVDDDPVISAYVYKCRVKRATKPPTTTE